jgi:hypothetical protein
MEMSTPRRGEMVVVPIKRSCRAVLYYERIINIHDGWRGRKRRTFEICVGRTSAEGIEKSQYRLNVF